MSVARGARSPVEDVKVRDAVAAEERARHAAVEPAQQTGRGGELEKDQEIGGRRSLPQLAVSVEYAGAEEGFHLEAELGTFLVAGEVCREDPL